MAVEYVEILANGVSKKIAVDSKTIGADTVEFQVTSIDIGGDGGTPVLLTAGQKAMASSAPVVIASDQTALSVTVGAAIAAGDNNIGNVDIVSLPAGSMAGVTAKTADLDTGGGTDTVALVGIALPASGGAVAGGTVTNPLSVQQAALSASNDHVDVANMGGVAYKARSTAASANLHAPASNTAAILTYAAAGSGVSHVISRIMWSYNATPTAGRLHITDGGTTVFDIDITNSGPGVLDFDPPLKLGANAATVVTVAAGGSSVTGKVNVPGKWTE